jgi:hypothetical protein
MTHARHVNVTISVAVGGGKGGAEGDRVQASRKWKL